MRGQGHGVSVAGPLARGRLCGLHQIAAGALLRSLEPRPPGHANGDERQEERNQPEPGAPLQGAQLAPGDCYGLVNLSIRLVFPFISHGPLPFRVSSVPPTEWPLASSPVPAGGSQASNSLLNNEIWGNWIRVSLANGTDRADNLGSLGSVCVTPSGCVATPNNSATFPKKTPRKTLWGHAYRERRRVG